MPQNTIRDFQETYKADKQEFVCAACGNPMSLNAPGSFKIVPSPRTLKVLNDTLISHRVYLEDIEALLAKMNTPGAKFKHDENPFLKSSSAGDKDETLNTEGGQHFKEFFHSFDIEGIHDAITKIGAKATNDTLDANGIKAILRSVNPARYIGYVLDILLDQRVVRDWITTSGLSAEGVDLKAKMQEVLSGSTQTPDRLLSLVYQCAPFYFRYLAKCLDDSNAQKYKPDVLACLYILAILFGHKSKDNAIPFVGSNLYSLPEQVYVEPYRVRDFLASPFTLRNGLALGLTQEALDKLQEKGSGQTASTNPTDIEQREQSLQSISTANSWIIEAIWQTFHVVCAGAPPTLPSIDGIDHPQPTICGWAPKDEPTHPILLVGSPASGKSSVMLTGFTLFALNSQSLGVSVKPNTAFDQAMLNSFIKQYYAGTMPRATEAQSRYSIGFTVVDTENPSKRINFVATDIPGEMFKQTLTNTGTSNVVKNLLKNAETIVFFFDFASEPKLMELIKHGTAKENWPLLFQDIERLQQSNRCDTHQSVLLEKTIEDIVGLRGLPSLQANVRILCVIPKIDYYIGSTEEVVKYSDKDDDQQPKRVEADRVKRTRFMNAFMDTLKQRKILDDSVLNKNTESEVDYNTLLSQASKLFAPTPPTGHSSETSPRVNSKTLKQKQVIDLIDKEARTHLPKIYEMLGEQNEFSETDKEGLKELIELTLLTQLDRTFKKAYVLPCSAQGKRPPASPADGTAGVEMKAPPPQKLTEYVFMTPVVLALLEQRGNPSESEDTETI